MSGIVFLYRNVQHFCSVLHDSDFHSSVSDVPCREAGRKKRMGNLTVTWNGRKVPEENASDRSALDDGERRSDGNTYFVEYLQMEIGGNVMYTLNSDN